MKKKREIRGLFIYRVNIPRLRFTFYFSFSFNIKKRLLIPSTSQETKQNGFLSVVLLTLAITSNTSYLYSTTYTTLVTKSTTRNVDTLCKLRAKNYLLIEIISGNLSKIIVLS